MTERLNCVFLLGWSQNQLLDTFFSEELTHTLRSLIQTTKSAAVSGRPTLSTCCICFVSVSLSLQTGHSAVVDLYGALD